MKPHDAACWSRREFLRGLTLAGTAGLVGLHARLVTAEPPPETTTLKIFNGPATCLAPQLVAEDLLRAEGFTDLQYVSPRLGRSASPWPPVRSTSPCWTLLRMC
jgi:hypothetical protein